MEQFQQWLATAWSWLNEPLPIIGVSTLIVCGFAWRIFASSSLGKRQIDKVKAIVEEWKAEDAKRKSEFDSEREKLEETVRRQTEEIAYLKDALTRALLAIKNKKAHEIAEELKEAEDGKETEEAVDGDPKEE